MKLYHGTSATTALRILQKGILPRKLHKKASRWTHSIESNRDTVYMTTAYSLYFALNAIDNVGDEAVAAVLEIDTDRLVQELIVPDEDVLEQANREKDDLPKHWTMQQRTRWYRSRIPLFSNAWPKSIEYMGTCGYKGIVKPEAITRVAYVPLKDCPITCLQFLDPTITILNYRLCGTKYRKLTAWLFKETVDLPDPLDGKWPFPPKEEQDCIEIVTFK